MFRYLRNVSFMIVSRESSNRPKSKVKSRTFDFGLMNITTWDCCYPPVMSLTGKAPGLWRRVTQRDELHSQVGEKAFKYLLLPAAPGCRGFSCSSIPSTSIQCLPSSRSTSRL